VTEGLKYCNFSHEICLHRGVAAIFLCVFTVDFLKVSPENWSIPSLTFSCLSFSLQWDFYGTVLCCYSEICLRIKYFHFSVIVLLSGYL
jgi:hypothetical protein